MVYFSTSIGLCRGISTPYVLLNLAPRPRPQPSLLRCRQVSTQAYAPTRDIWELR
jgi:hypothetical protein